MSHREQIYDKEKVQFNLVKYQKHGRNFELAVDPDLAIDYKDKEKKSDDDLIELIRAEKVFADVKKGLIASPEDLKTVFATEKFLDIARVMLREGEIQLTAEHREKLRAEKRKQIVYLIHRSAINPKSNTPHPAQRIENAMNDAKVKVDEYKRAEDQVQDVLSKLKPIMPITMEELTLSLSMPTRYASKLHGVLEGYGKITNEIWAGEEYHCQLKMPAGLQGELLDDLNNQTHGSVTIEKKK